MAAGVEKADFEAYLESLVTWRPPSAKLPRIRSVESEWGPLYAMDTATLRMSMLAAFSRRDQAMAKIICFMRKWMTPLGIDEIRSGAGLDDYSIQGVRNVLDVLRARQAVERRGLSADGAPSTRDLSYALTTDMRKLATDPRYEKFHLGACGH